MPKTLMRIIVTSGYFLNLIKTINMPAGRPTKPDNKKKTERFQFMLTPDEMDARGGRDEVNQQIRDWNENYKAKKYLWKID